MITITKSNEDLDLFFITDTNDENQNDQITASGKTILEAAANLASLLYQEGSAYWHSYIAGILTVLYDTEIAILNQGGNPFSK
jgi:hypothetical protein